MTKRAMVLGSLVLLAVAGCSDPVKDLASSDAKKKIQAIQELAAAGDDKAVEHLSAATRQEDVRVASEAAFALGRVSSPRAAEALREAVASEKRPEVRRWAVTGLAQREEPEAANTLRQLVTKDPSPEVRAEAAIGLGRVGTVDDVNLLASTVVTEPDPRTTRSQVTAMESILGVKFPYDPNASVQERKEAADRIRAAALRLAETRRKPLTAAQVRAKH